MRSRLVRTVSLSVHGFPIAAPLTHTALMAAHDRSRCAATLAGGLLVRSVSSFGGFAVRRMRTSAEAVPSRRKYVNRL